MSNEAKETNLDWLLGHVRHTGDECLLWPFGKVRGYGQMSIGTKKIKKAHRVMCQLAHGPGPTPKHEAAHKCGNRACVNPMHLSWKTRSENQAESVAMGRFWSGGKRGKLNREQAVQIRALKGRLSQTKIAEQFGVTHSNVAKIHRGELWRDPA